MACINRILCIAVTVIIAQCTVKLTEHDPASLTCKAAFFSRCIICTIIIISIIPIQFIVCIIVIQRTGNIFVFASSVKLSDAISTTLVPVFFHVSARGVSFGAQQPPRWPLVYTASSFVSAQKQFLSSVGIGSHSVLTPFCLVALSSLISSPEKMIERYPWGMSI